MCLVFKWSTIQAMILKNELNSLSFRWYLDPHCMISLFVADNLQVFALDEQC